MKKILVIDGNSIINRAFYGVRPLTNKAGKHTNAIFGMINIISKQLDALRPDYAAVAFDLKEPTFRHKMYPHYKEGRHPTPEELKEQFPDAKECLSYMGFHILELPGYEADDIQGTVASMAQEEEDTESYILTGDRDLLQLIDDKITVLLATNNDTKPMRRQQFTEKYGIAPENFVDMKALMGDSSDNIPGVKGVGEKTAAGLIGEFKTLENIYSNIESPSISKGVRAKLTENKDNAYLSRELARIDTKAPIGKTLFDLKYKGLDYDGLFKKFTELELNSFIAKFKVREHLSGKTPEIMEENKEITVTEFKKPVISADIPRGYAVPLLERDGELLSFDGKETVTLDENNLREIFSGSTPVICFDGKGLWHRLHRMGIAVSDKVRLLDLSLYAYVLNPGSGSSTLCSLAAMFLGEAIPEEEITPLHLCLLEKKMKERVDADGLSYVLFDIEIPLIPILASIEAYGFKIDSLGMLEYADSLDELAKELTERIYFQAGGEFNINSPKQLGEMLFLKLGLPYKKKKNKNGFSTDAETLEELRAYSPIIDDILEYRQVTKLRNTYAAQLPKLTDENGRIHTDFKQALTATGRLSSADPNLQNIPIRTKMGRQMRKYFIADEGNLLVDADYSQIELRLLAHISGDYNMSEAFLHGEDIHRKTASAVFGVPEDSVTEEMRKRAKAVNFGIVYGISGFSLAKDIGTTTTEANKYIKNYLLNYLSIDKYLEDVVSLAKEKGYTETLMGRRRYIPELNGPGPLRALGKRIAMNAPIQGTAADIMKIAMIKTARRLREDAPEAKIVMQVHDELVVECPEAIAPLVKEILTEEMSDAVKLSVPLPVEVTSGKNWLEQG